MTQTDRVDDPASIYADALAVRVSRAQMQREALLAAIDETRRARSLEFADDEHDPDGSMASLDQARDVALLQRTKHTLAELAAAQRRLAIGDYGVCESCDQDIGNERLLALPETRWCLTCAKGAVTKR